MRLPSSLIFSESAAGVLIQCCGLSATCGAAAGKPFITFTVFVNTSLLELGVTRGEQWLNLTSLGLFSFEVMYYLVVVCAAESGRFPERRKEDAVCENVEVNTEYAKHQKMSELTVNSLFYGCSCTAAALHSGGNVSQTKKTEMEVEEVQSALCWK